MTFISWLEVLYQFLDAHYHCFGIKKAFKFDFIESS